jgi:hypothetical protein
VEFQSQDAVRAALDLSGSRLLDEVIHVAPKSSAAGVGLGGAAGQGAAGGAAAPFGKASWRRQPAAAQ